jgi:integrase
MADHDSTGYHPLTANECRYLKEGFLADAQCPGLRLVANKAGQKRWVYRRLEDGKLKQGTIGYYPRLSLTEAREQWQDMRGKRNRGEVITEGPVYTVKALCSDYIKGYAQRLKRSWKEDERQLWLDIVPVWGERQASTITRAEVISHIEAVATRGDRVAMLLLAVCRKVWNYALPRDNDITGNPFARLKVNKGVCMDVDERIRVEERPARCLINGRDESDLQTFLAKLPTAPMHQDTRDILLLQLLTACRKGEVCEMSWEDIDLRSHVWTIPPEKTKNKVEHRVMLPTQALTILKGRGGREGYVFASRSNVGHIRGDSINQTVTACLEYFGIKPWVPHTLRHTAITGLSMQGCPEVVIARIANHKRSTITSRYDHNPHDDEAREWLQRWADHLEEVSHD